jgi:hypothetical protein
VWGARAEDCGDAIERLQRSFEKERKRAREREEREKREKEKRKGGKKAEREA